VINRRQPRYSKGQRIADRFLIHQVLMGGMGEVYLCFDEEDLLPYALKTFQGSSPELADIFKREVASWIALEKHPNIVRCFWMEKFDNIPFMSLEWVAAEEGRGTDLRSWLQRGALDLPIALRFTIDIVRGLIHAGEKSPGIVHRDLKPDNVLVDGSCQAKITDFGLATVAQLARLVSDTTDEANLEQSRHIGGIVGTPAYMPPEQWRGEGDIDFRADVYAVGCMLYELLTGEWLYNARTISELRAQHLEALLPVLNHHFPAALKWVLEGCLAKRREERYARLDELLAELIKLHEAHSDEPLPEVKAQAFTASDYNNRGVTFNNLEQHRRAITDYDEAIRIDPTFAQAYYNRGNSYSALGQHERAITDYDEAIRVDPTFAQAYTNRGRSYSALGQHERAITDYDETIRVDPNDAVAYYNRGRNYSALGQHERAITDYDEAIRLDPTLAQAYTNRGYSYAGLGQHERAIADHDEAIRLDPTLAQAYTNRGYSYGTLGQHERAIANFDEAIRLDPTYVQAYYNRGSIHSDLGQHERAIANFDEAIRLDPTLAQAWLNKGVVLADSGLLEEAISCFKRSAELGEPNGSLYEARVRKIVDQSAAFDAFQYAYSLDMMQQAVAEFPVLAQIIPTIEKIIARTLPPQYHPLFDQRLAWLRQVVKGK
jgi:tetratricopeptide (TPR) repeat protein